MGQLELTEIIAQLDVIRDGIMDVMEKLVDAERQIDAVYSEKREADTKAESALDDLLLTQVDLIDLYRAMREIGRLLQPDHLKTMAFNEAGRAFKAGMNEASKAHGIDDGIALKDWDAITIDTRQILAAGVEQALYKLAEIILKTIMEGHDGDGNEEFPAEEGT